MADVAWKINQYNNCCDGYFYRKIIIKQSTRNVNGIALRCGESHGQLIVIDTVLSIHDARKLLNMLANHKQGVAGSVRLQYSGNGYGYYIIDVYSRGFYSRMSLSDEETQILVCYLKQELAAYS